MKSSPTRRGRKSGRMPAIIFWGIGIGAPIVFIALVVWFGPK